MRDLIGGHHKAAVEGALAIVLAVAALSLSGSQGYFQQIASDPVRRAAAYAGGELSAKGLQRISTGLSPYALSAADGVEKGGWAPRGVDGWDTYVLTHPPDLIDRQLSFEEARAFNALLAPTATTITPMKPFRLPQTGAAERERALLCLTQAVYYEAGFESGEGQQAVAQVVLNRMRHPGYPNSVCGVVYQGSQRATGCQFSFTCDGSLANAPQPAAWARARTVASQALNGFVYTPIGAATHYHADYVFPYWAVTLLKLKQIGAHIFYRMTGPMGSPPAFLARYAGGETRLSAAVLMGGDARTPDAPSAVAQLKGPSLVKPETVTLTVGGETRTYTVGPAQIPAEAAGPGLPALPGAPGITPSRLRPTPEQIARINAALKKFEETNARPAAAAAAVAPPRPAEPSPE